MNKIIETLRRRVSASSLRVVSAPYLPSSLIAAALILVYTDWMVILLGQSGAYWIDASRATSSLPAIQDVLSAGILPYLLAGLAYLLLVWLLLSILTRSLALLLWMVFSLVHLAHILSWGIWKFAGMGLSLSNQVWIHASTGLILGILLVQMLLRSNPAPNGWTAKLKPILTILWSVLLIAAVLASAFGERGGWVRLQPDHSPGRRANAGIAHDLARQRIVMFGGISDWLGGKFLYENSTWEWEGSDWIEMHPETVPLPRAGHMMAYDEKRGVVVMFGGEDKSGKYVFSDTWIWDGTDWKEILVDSSPQGRRGGQLFYDPARETVILTGGFYFSYEDQTPIMIDDMWEWNGKEWKYLGYMPTSLIITNPNTVYDPVRGQTLLFNYNQVLAWENDQWLETDIAFTLPPRLGVQAAIDPLGGKLLVFGGVNNGVQLEDTWILGGNTWQELHPDPAPSVRDAYMMFHDPVRNSIILYGGISGYTFDDMWELVIP
ncbi:MAG: hypothetical protein IH588_09100 [Anaerolineales bacterium]|nr:hypothetical protein [Anaerolineales bacterium]